MSDTMLHGVLNIPPELWINSEVDKIQRYSRYIEASQRIKFLKKKCENLERQLETIRINGDYHPTNSGI